MAEAEKAIGSAELRELAGQLAETARLALGTSTSTSKGPEYEAQAQAVAELCRDGRCDESLIPQWIEEGRRRAEAARQPSFSGGVHPLGCRPAAPLVPGRQVRACRELPAVAAG